MKCRATALSLYLIYLSSLVLLDLISGDNVVGHGTRAHKTQLEKSGNQIITGSRTFVRAGNSPLASRKILTHVNRNM